MLSCDASGPKPTERDPEEPPSEGPSVSLELTGETEREAIRLEWDGTGLEEADRFRVYRGTESGFDTTGTAVVDTSATSFSDADLEPSTQYFYRVGAYKADSTLTLSEEEEAVSPPEKVSGLTGEGEFYRSALQWEKAKGAEKGYHVYRSKESFSSMGEAERLTSKPVGEAEFTDSTALDGVNYVYRVAAVGPEGHEGAFSPEAKVTPSFEGNPLRGEQLVGSVCGDCHTAKDGWDLAAFGFPDTTIHRRGIDHVSEQEVQDIIRFVESKDTEVLPGTENGVSELPPFQPGGRVLESDRAFAMEVFGQDQWPKDLTEEELLSFDPRKLPVPLEMPRWSIEKNAQDWLPERPLPEEVRTDPDFQFALSQYRETRSDEDLVRTVRAFDNALTEGERFPGEHGNTGREAFFESFEMYRWLSTLIGTHFLRSGNVRIPEQVDGRPVEGRHFGMTNPWWRVGDIMRRFDAFRDDEPDEALKIAARWFHLAWSFRQDVVGHEQKYMSKALSEGFGLDRVSAFSLAYGIVDGAENNHHLYTDLLVVHRHTPESWQGNLMIFLLEHLIERWESGDRLDPDHQRKFARKGVREGTNNILENNNQLTPRQRDRLKTLRDELLSLLNE
ncbi:MAG: fibronectin type III domain-containing protein [Salinibacter sp.]